MISLVLFLATAVPGPSFQMECDSSNYRLTTCNAGVVIDHVDLLQQNSSAGCVYGQSWGYDQYNVWVDRGCRGLFLVTQHQEPPYFDLECDSHSYQYTACDTFAQVEYVELIQQVSNAGCAYGNSWGYDRRYVWVDRGCRGIFRVHGWRGDEPVTRDVGAPE